MTEHEIQKLLQQLGDHLEELKQIFDSTNEEKLCQKPDDDTWSPKEILGHLVDVEIVFTHRLKQFIDEENPTLYAFNQNMWVKEQEFNQWDTSLNINALIALRRNLVFWLGRIPNAMWNKEGNHTKRGKVTFKSHVELLSTHLETHFKQIKERIG